REYEKGAVDRREMPLISAVFWTRLKLEMPLQADPTVQYAVGKDRQRLTRDDLLTDSPFNTYRRGGLPPRPFSPPPPPPPPRPRPQRTPPPSTISTSSPRATSGATASRARSRTTTPPSPYTGCAATRGDDGDPQQ